MSETTAAQVVTLVDYYYDGGDFHAGNCTYTATALSGPGITFGRA
ncbi:MAG TPA: hypothetical protein VNW15_04330 [Rhizomicrobium sp.]|jgi:hypothetical protein|nr:hypothetical protein [Rhizomicrobium sp.]